MSKKKKERAKSVEANTKGLWRNDKARLTERVYTRERRAGPNPLLNNHRLTTQTHNWYSLFLSYYRPGQLSGLSATVYKKGVGRKAQIHIVKSSRSRGG